MCVFVSMQLPGNQRFDRQISAHKKGGGVRRVGQWIGTWCITCFITFDDLIGIILQHF